MLWLSIQSSLDWPSLAGVAIILLFKGCLYHPLSFAVYPELQIWIFPSHCTVTQEVSYLFYNSTDKYKTINLAPNYLLTSLFRSSPITLLLSTATSCQLHLINVIAFLIASTTYLSSNLQLSIFHKCCLKTSCCIPLSLSYSNPPHPVPESRSNNLLLFYKILFFIGI